MTTIAYKNGIVAADGLAGVDNLIVSNNEKKIFVINRGIVAGCGNFAEINKMVQWLASCEDLNTDQPRVNSIVILFTPKKLQCLRKVFTSTKVLRNILLGEVEI